MNPEDVATDYLVSYLEADTTLMGMLNGVVAPEVKWGSLPSPFVRLDFLGGTDVTTVGQYRIWGDMTYHVYGVFHWTGSGRPDRTDVNAIGERLDQLLHRHQDVTAAIEISIFRQEPEPSPTVPDNEGVWLQSGGVYRVLSKALT